MIRRAEAARAEESNERLQKILDLVASSVEHEGFHGAAMAFVTRLAQPVRQSRPRVDSAGVKVRSCPRRFRKTDDWSGDWRYGQPWISMQ
jgi:hypothetical protein